MIRLALLFSVLAVVPVVAQTALQERPGQWIPAPRGEVSVMEAPATAPLIPTTSAPVVELTAPEIVTEITLPPAAPDTRPVPRPRAVEVPEVALQVEVGTPDPVALPVAQAPVARPGPDGAVAVAATLAAKTVTVTPGATSFTDLEAAFVTVSEGVARSPARLAEPPVVIPMLATALPVQPAAMSAVLLPVPPATQRSWVQPVAFNVPPIDPTPILPRLNPSGPAASDQTTVLPAPRPASLSAVLLPSIASQPAQVPPMARAVAPGLDLFPMSALPPSSLAEGPDSLSRVGQPPNPFAEINAAVLAGAPSAIPARLAVPVPTPMPLRDAPVSDPEAPFQFPAPDPAAVARMMEDAMICWRMADLPAEARWARLSVDVALDETNMPSAQSIRLTGFARVVSSAAEDAYRAARSALVGCAEASESAPATSSATLVFDRDGVRLQ